MTSGYSRKSLSDKLGLKAGQIALVINPPTNYPLLLGDDVSIEALPELNTNTNWVQIFAIQKQQLKNFINSSLPFIDKKGVLWVSWPKKSSKVVTELTEDVLREIFLPVGLVDVKVIAVDEIWSGLKFVWRKENR